MLRTSISPMQLRSLACVALTLTTLAACSSDDDDEGGGIPSAAFTSTLNAAQEIPAPIAGSTVRVSIRNLAPTNGTFQTPLWFGVHDGQFDLYDLGSSADTDFPLTNALERLAEDGDVDPLTEAFETQAFGTTQGVLAGVLGAEPGPIAPGETVTTTFRVDPTNAESRYFSYASMVIPSNDAFIANADPLAHEIYDAGGSFVAVDFIVVGGDVLDAGTEVNDEVPANTAFFGQAAPDTGTDESGVVAVHPGFMSAGSGGILDDAMFVDADFTAGGYQMLAVSFFEVATPAPATGLASWTFNPNNAQLSFNISANGLSGPATGMHLHSGAAGVAGPIESDLFDTITHNSNGVLNASGVRTLTESQVTLLEAEELYLNIHTALNPSGEVRGQVNSTRLAAGTGFAATLNTAQEIPAPVLGTRIRVTARNRAPEFGTFQTPVWIGFHDGQFDTYDLGSPASTQFPLSNALERIAEDGNAGPLDDTFDARDFGEVRGMIAGIDGPIAPGESASHVFQLDPTATDQAYFSYASMVIPSNDAFLANGDPLGHMLFDAGGAFVGTDFVLRGTDVLDAGTEVNDEVPANTAFFGQTTPDTGVDEVGVVATHAGFMATGMGGILDDAMFANADITAVGYETLEFRFQELGPGTPATGQAIVTLSDDEMSIDFQISAVQLSGPATAMHFHRARAGVAGPVELDIFDTLTTNSGGVLAASGSRPVDAMQVSALKAGGFYLNVHTALNPAGELRGQVTATE